MNRLFVRALATILSAVLVLAGLLTVLAVVGLQRSIEEWDAARRGQLEELAAHILRDGPGGVTVPDNIPLFVYDEAGTLVFSNRGQGARPRSGGEPSPLLSGGNLIGYYQTADMHFRSDAANRRFIETLDRSLRLGLVVSLVVSVALALLFSRSLSAPAVRVAQALDRITRGDLFSVVRREGAREIALIGDSANRLRLELLREQGLRRQWVQDVAHDLRTPVAALSAQLEGLRDGVLSPSTERMDSLMKELGRVQQLIADLEELMRLESPEMRTSVEPLDVRATVEEVHGRFEHVLAAKRIDFRTKISVVQIVADGRLLQRALTNFIDNATRHCPDCGVVTVAVQRDSGFVRVSVVNTGQPIPADELDRVFDRLFRGEHSRHSAGSGLGLTIARRIAELHGGEVHIANRSDGVVVEMRLPQSGGPLPPGAVGYIAP